MKIALTGSNGFIGNALVDYFRSRGDQITRVVRPGYKPYSFEKVILWEPLTGSIERKQLEGHDIVINLAGENIAAGRWTPERKDLILRSRVVGTKLLSQAIVGLKNPPKLFFSASAIGYYGHYPCGEVVDEDSRKGNAFLPDVCEKWEEATRDASENGVRVVNMRLGMVLSTRGGTLRKMIQIFNKHLGAKLGSGKQIVSWISMDDLCLALSFLIEKPQISGAVNFVSPNPETNSDFTIILSRVMQKPAHFTMPKFLLRILFGEMADELLLGGKHVVPSKLITSHFKYSFPSLESYISRIIGR